MPPLRPLPLRLANDVPVSLKELFVGVDPLSVVRTFFTAFILFG